MKKTILFNGKHLVKSKMRSFFVLEVQYVLLVIIEFDDGSDESEAFDDQAEEYVRIVEISDRYHHEKERSINNNPLDHPRYYRSDNLGYSEAKIKEIDKKIKEIRQSRSIKAEARLDCILNEYQQD